MSDFVVVLPAAGKSSRFGNPFQKKVFTLLAGKPLWMHSAEKFASRADVSQVILVIAPEDKEVFNEKFAGHAAIMGVRTVVGGKNRAESVWNALQSIKDGSQFVAVHDAARPCISDESIDAVFETTRRTGAAILAERCHSTVKKVDESKKIVETLPREQLWMAQTPQCFDLKNLISCYQQHPDLQFASDEACLLEACGQTVTVVEGNPMNIKVTTQADLRFAEMAIKSSSRSKGFPF